MCYQGGAHLMTDVVQTLLNTSPSSLWSLVCLFANFNSYDAFISQSPELSPVNIRPVLLPPRAAGARPIINTSALGSPKLGTGLDQYCSLTKRLVSIIPILVE